MLGKDNLRPQGTIELSEPFVTLIEGRDMDKGLMLVVEFNALQ